VADEIRMKVSELLLREVRDPRVQGVHLTRVEMTNDLSVARLYWRTLPGLSVEEAEAGLAKAAGFLRREVAPSLGLRHAPELRFELDSLPDEADRVEELLAQVRATGSAGTPGAAADEDDDEQDGAGS
jgi:ribosome-binding factor A